MSTNTDINPKNYTDFMGWDDHGVAYYLRPAHTTHTCAYPHCDETATEQVGTETHMGRIDWNEYTDAWLCRPHAQDDQRDFMHGANPVSAFRPTGPA